MADLRHPSTISPDSPATSQRPSWQRDECPAWCVVAHREDDLPDDRIHESAAQALTLATPTDPDAEFFMAISRAHDTDVDWIFIGRAHLGGEYLQVSRESAARLAHEVLELLQ